MANYGDGSPAWSLPQDAALQAQQAYQAQAVAAAYPNHSGTPVTGIAPHAVTPPRPSGVGGPTAVPSAVNVHRNNRLARMEDKVLVTRTADEETEDGRIRNKEAMAKIRDAWVYKQIRSRVDEFTEYKQVRTSI
jgi:hypothetical protein